MPRVRKQARRANTQGTDLIDNCISPTLVGVSQPVHATAPCGTRTYHDLRSGEVFLPGALAHGRTDDRRGAAGEPRETRNFRRNSAAAASTDRSEEQKSEL